ncbi:MAG: hypothetical protein HQK54_17495, partial [Oligoflexales bacterium]|nr:hypothetical protein [Oligoflexales bacterium]
MAEDKVCASTDLLSGIARAVVGLEDFFDGYELLHANLTGLRHTLEDPDEAIRFLQGINEADLAVFDDEFPAFRRTYIRGLISSILAQCRYFLPGLNPGHPVQRKVESLFSTSLPPPVDLESAWNLVCEDRMKIKAGGTDFSENLKTPLIIPEGRFEKYPFSKRLRKRLERVFGDLPFWHRMHVSLESPDEGTPSCFYYYQGNYRGIIGHDSPMDGQPDKDLSAFLFHETVPGHHFYYCLREYSWRKGKADIIQTIDPFYSPETPVNEGIATCIDL